ncbi:MAG: hypothetical protein HY665_02710 [Chloroflexi bacterium]|nr:hypothetical protein [Chloroflexota bacterium]
MVEFLKSYGIWIVLVLMLGMHLVPMFRHGKGMGGGCCGGGHQHDPDESEKKDGQQEPGTQSSGHHH